MRAPTLHDLLILRRLRLLVVAFWLGQIGGIMAQETPANLPQNDATETGDAGEKSDQAEVADELSFERRLSFDLERAQKDRLKKWLPNTYRKLAMRQPIHMVALGDSIVDMFGYDEDAGNWLKAYPAQFAAQLAHQFFYTGGVRIIRPNKGQPSKSQPHLGVEITLRNLGRGGKLSTHALQAFSTYGMESKPDLVLVSFGINDATNNLDLGTYARNFQAIVDTVKAAGADIILLGPTLTVDSPPEEDMALTRYYSETLRDVAAANQVLFVDLGDLAGLIQVPDELSEPGEIFDAIVENYRQFFLHPNNTLDYVHPVTSLHEKLGKKIYDELINGPTEVPWRILPGMAKLSDNGVEAVFEVENTGGEELNLVVLPLIPRGWKPLDASPQMTLPAGSKKTVKIGYAKRSLSTEHINSLPGHETLLRLPVLISAGGMARIEGARLELQPLNVLWKVETQFNQEGEFVPPNLVVNTSGKRMVGEWRASWLGQTLQGSFEVEADGKKELPLRFPFPKHEDQPFTQEAELNLVVQIGNESFSFKRITHLTKNVGLKEAIPLMEQGGKKTDGLPSLGDRTPALIFKADADKDHLFFTFDIRGRDLQDDPATGQAWNATLNLDARSYGKRLTPGATDAIRLNGSAADGPANVGSIPPWVFGAEYAARFDESHVKVVLSSGTEGARRLTVTIPRSYLYLHEWALKNGNSQVGMNIAFAFWNAPIGDQAASTDVYTLLRSRQRDDVEGMAVLELTESPTKRWSVSLR